MDRNQSDYSYPLKAGACWWWLRSPGGDKGDAAFVKFDGRVFNYGCSFMYTDGCVRPVVCARL